MLSWRYRRVLQAEAAALAGSVQPAQAGNTADDELDELKHVAFREERGLVGSSILAGSTKRLLKAFECLAKLRQKVKCEGPNWERDRNTNRVAVRNQQRLRESPQLLEATLRKSGACPRCEPRRGG